MSNRDIIALISSEGDKAVDQIIEDSKRLHLIVNGKGTESAITEDGSLIPSVRKAIIDNFHFKTPPLPWRNGGSVTVFNQLYSFSDVAGKVTWWYAPGATSSAPVIMMDSPFNDVRFRLFVDNGNIQDIFAPITSPTFLGNPRTPKPDPEDNSDSIASTQWVQEELEPIRELVEGALSGNFTDINVTNKATLKDAEVGGELIVTGNKIDARAAEASFKRIVMVGSSTVPGSITEIAFEESIVPPSGITTKSNVQAYQMSTGELTVDKLNAKSATIGNVSSSGDSLNVEGDMRGDYLHLEGNSGSPADRPQLIVDGTAEIENLKVTGTVEGLDMSVDGDDISPNSVQVKENMSVAGSATVTGSLTAHSVAADNVEVSGTLTAPDINTDDLSCETLVVSQSITQTSGSASLKDVVISGTVTLSADSSLSASQVTSKLFAVDPGNDIVVSDPSWTPDGRRSVYNVTFTRDAVINPITAPAGAGTYFLYIEQDSVGGHAITFDPAYLKIGEETINTAPSSVTLVQVLYRGKGSFFDYTVLRRG